MATTPLSLDVKVEVHVDEAALERLQKAQDRFGDAMQELYASINEVQMATANLSSAITTTAVAPEPEPEAPTEPTT